MPRLLLPGIKEALLSKIKQGESINSISRSLGLWKSTIYHHYKKLRGKRYQTPHFSPEASEQEGEIVGIFAGDGSQFFEPKKYHYEVNVHFGGHRLGYAEYVKHLFEGYFNKKFRLRKEKAGVLRLRTQSKDIFNYFSHYIDYQSQIKHCTIYLKNLSLPRAFNIGFLRGLVDTDGSVLFNMKEKRYRVTYYTTSRRLANQIQFLLWEFKIISSIYVVNQKHYKPIYHVNVLSRSIDTFLKIIQPFKAIRASNSIR